MSNRTRRDPVGAARDQLARMKELEANRPDGRASAWAAKGDPGDQSSPFRTVWGRGVESPGASMDAQSEPTGILILSSGTYEVLAQHRAGAAGGEVSIALTGSRVALQAYDGILTWDAAAAAGAFTSSTYIGQLFLGDLVTAGRPSAATGSLQYGAGLGILRIRRIS